MKLSEIEEGSRITLLIYNDENKMQMEAVIMKHIREDIALISIDYDTKRKLVFENVRVDMEYCTQEGVPHIWRSVKVVSYKADYAIQVFSEGVRHNRRGCFRVSVAIPTTVHVEGGGSQPIMVKDVSLSGFSIADRKKELRLKMGDRLSLKFEDLGHILDLKGIVVRIQEEEDMLIYGLETQNMCKDLSSYINAKQRRKEK